MNNQTKIGGYNISLIQLIKAGTGYNKEYRASYNRYRVIITLDNRQAPRAIENIFTPKELKNLSYWSNRSQTMAMTCWGISQSFEAQLALGRFFNMEIKNEEWGDYTKRVQNLIQIL